jgi:hypothetical protein
VPLPDNYYLGVLPTGWTNSSIAVEWLKGFDQQTKTRSKGRYRLLLMDGHNSHLTMEFIDYCETHFIIAYCLPPHTTHFLQPLDVGVFNPFKTAQQKVLECARDDLDNEYNKREFLAHLHGIRVATFTGANIKSAWRKTGLVPFNPNIVLDALPRQLPPQRETTPVLADDNRLAVYQAQMLETPRTPLDLKRQWSHFEDLLEQGNALTPYARHLRQKIEKGSQIAALQAATVTAEVERLKTASDERQRRKTSRRFTAGPNGGVVQVQWARDEEGCKLHAEQVRIQRREERLANIAAHQALDAGYQAMLARQKEAEDARNMRMETLALEALAYTHMLPDSDNEALASE